MGQGRRFMLNVLRELIGFTEKNINNPLRQLKRVSLLRHPPQSFVKPCQLIVSFLRPIALLTS